MVRLRLLDKHVPGVSAGQKQVVTEKPDHESRLIRFGGEVQRSFSSSVVPTKAMMPGTRSRSK